MEKPKEKMDKSKAIIEVININKSFGDLHTLENVSLSLAKNQIVTLIGPSGCGKSTLFDIISGLEKPDRGQVFIGGENYIGKTGRVSYMHQKDLLLPWNTILNNVCISLIIKGFKRSQSCEKAGKYFKLFGLEGFENHYPSQLSGGMKQRAALLRTYLFADDIMLLDEPFGSLDAITRRKMQLWLLEILEKLKASVLFITHDIDEAIFLSDRIYLLSKRPAVVKEVFDVNIKKPRGSSTLTSKEFIKIKEKILDIL